MLQQQANHFGGGADVVATTVENFLERKVITGLTPPKVGIRALLQQLAHFVDAIASNRVVERKGSSESERNESRT